MQTPGLTYHWRLLDGVTDLLDGRQESARLLPDRKPVQRETIAKIPQVILSRFAAGWNEITAANDPAKEADWLAMLDWLTTLRALGLVRVEMRCGPTTLVTLIPRDDRFEMPLTGLCPEGLEAKPFLYARPCAEGIKLEEPDTPITAILHCPCVKQAVLSSQALQLRDASTSTREICGLLAKIGFFQTKDAETAISRTWEFHDRLMLKQIQLHDYTKALGATHRFGLSEKKRPIEEPAAPGIALPEKARTSQPFDVVLNSRRSCRHIGETPIALSTIGNLLARAWRDAKTAEGNRGIRRPFPSGGAIHELELIVLARNVQGLTPGAYLYCSRSHALHPHDLNPEAMDMLCDRAGNGPGVSGAELGCLMIVRSRLPKLANVYEKVAMKLTLMNSGAALQTLQLSATDLGLNSWIIGGGMDFDKDNTVLGQNEFSVAGFAIGEPN